MLLRVLISLVVGDFCWGWLFDFLVILLVFLRGLCYVLVSCCFIGYYVLLVWLVLGWVWWVCWDGLVLGGGVGVFKYCE